MYSNALSARVPKLPLSKRKNSGFPIIKDNPIKISPDTVVSIAPILKL
jgi:hypothetical protein